MKDNSLIWKPNATVATVVEDGGRFLFVEELDDKGRLVFNQPAGHLDPGESLLQAAVRETLEETGWEVELTGVVCIALYSPPGRDLTYLRTCFAARPLRHHPQRPLDQGIQRALWMTRDELAAQSAKLRSPLVSHVLDRYLAGNHYPLALFSDPVIA